MFQFKKKVFRVPEVAETTIGLAGADIMFINQSMGYNEPEDTYQEAWSEYMKVQYALTLLAVVAKSPDIAETFISYLKDATVARIKAGSGTEILKNEVTKDTWFSDAEKYRKLPLDKIPDELYNNLAPLMPLTIGDKEEKAMRQYLVERIPFIYKSLMKLNFEI